jgi:5-methylcytosine-specific restriction endonuclease McrA
MFYQCPRCEQKRPDFLFQLYKGHPNGWCQDCKRALQQADRRAQGIPERRLSRIEDGRKLCMECGEMKVFSEFGKNKRGLGGLVAYCKPCQDRRFRKRDVWAARTRKSREKNRERHLAQHRLRMFEYRTKKKVASDGTVTEAVLRDLYATCNCFYCGHFTPEKERTIDHKIPLSRNGQHSVTNLVMACWTCNCSKRDLTDEEFMEGQAA